MTLSVPGMKENSKAWWDALYQVRAPIAYGKEPSSWLMKYKDLMKPQGLVADIGCGEGRNAVGLALSGFNVRGFDFSHEALKRAEVLAKEAGVSVEWKSSDLDLFLPELMTYDAVVSIDFKAPKTLFNNLSRGLKQNGHLLLEAPLMQTARDKKAEVFECFQPNELMKLFQTIASSYRLLHYSELEVGDKVTLIAQKMQLM